METTTLNRNTSSVRRNSDGDALKLSDLVYAKIAANIRSGDYPIDSRLPTENELADNLGVSRPVVREALARLRNEGVIISRRGSGTYVQKVQDVGEGSHPPLTSILDMRRCLEYRVSVEGEAAWHAAHGAAEYRTALTKAMAELDSDFARRELAAENDFGFHLGVATATGNRFFAETLLNLKSSIMTAMSITPNFISLHADERVARVHFEHQAIYERIMANDAEGARDAMRHHLTQAMNRVFEGV